MISHFSRQFSTAVAPIFVLATILLTSCGQDGLGMKVEITEKASPSTSPSAAHQQTLASLSLATTGNANDLEAIAETSKELDLPKGELLFTELSIRNRTMEHPSRGSAEIDGTCIWTEAGETPVAYSIRVRTHSIPLDSDTGPQLTYLRTEAIRGMMEHLLDEL